MQFGIFTIGDVTTDPTTGRTPTESERIRNTVEIEATTATTGQTGVEMEALTAASVASYAAAK